MGGAGEERRVGFDDRLRDENPERLRDSAASYVDVARALARLKLDAGEHPADALAAAAVLLEQWEDAYFGAGPELPAQQARRIAAIVGRVADALPSRQVVRWFVDPHAGLDGRTQQRERRAGFGDRLFDENEDRLRDAAAHYIDVVHALVRRRLAQRRSAVDALTEGASALEAWMVARAEPGWEANATAERISELVKRLREVMSAEQVLAFHLKPDDSLGGQTPIQAYVDHRLYDVEKLVGGIVVQSTLEALNESGDEEGRS